MVTDMADQDVADQLAVTDRSRPHLRLLLVLSANRFNNRWAAPTAAQRLVLQGRRHRVVPSFILSAF